jgi:hypothetical protein
MTPEQIEEHKKLTKKISDLENRISGYESSLTSLRRSEKEKRLFLNVTFNLDNCGSQYIWLDTPAMVIIRDNLIAYLSKTIEELKKELSSL